MEQKFRRLIKNNRLHHSYIFFGAESAKKSTLIHSLAGLLERGVFAPAYNELKETLLISPTDKNSIGIDDVRNIRQFLSRRPIFCLWRIAIVERAECMTAQAQHALLKISEEPPEYALILLAVKDSDTLLSTIRSRFQKIYVSSIFDEAEVWGERGEDVALARAFLCEEKRARSQIIKTIIEDEREWVSEFISMIIWELRGRKKNCSKSLAFALKIQERIHQTGINKRLQLEALSGEIPRITAQ